MGKHLFAVALATLLFSGHLSCQNPREGAPLVMPEWAKNATIYEINVRQFSPEGTFEGVAKQLNRLKQMGVDIIWLMPIHPISKAKRKGSVGSHYSVADYTAVNPDYGTLDDFKSLVLRAHNSGIKVIIDWVPNHTGWDHPWIQAHPEWYTRVNGQITEPLNPDGTSTGWTDVADLNYDNREMRRAMVEALDFWVREADLDGYRMDVAGFVPYDFWYELRPALHQRKQLFMLAEWEDPALFKHNAFDMCYGWEFHHVMKRIYKGEVNANQLDTLLAKERREYAVNHLKMRFTSNHDENSWNGTESELFGDAINTFFVLSALIDGMPLMYNGQESMLDRRLAFFEKDPIDWKKYQRETFFRLLFELKHQHEALWNGSFGAVSERLRTTRDDAVYAFARRKGKDKVVVVLNLSAETREFTLKAGKCAGNYTDAFLGRPIQLKGKTNFKLAPWEYRVLVVKK